MTDYQQDEWHDDDEVDWDALWEELYASRDREVFCFCCGFPLLASGECDNPYCEENPAFIPEDNGPE